MKKTLKIPLGGLLLAATLGAAAQQPENRPPVVLADEVQLHGKFQSIDIGTLEVLISGKIYRLDSLFRVFAAPGSQPLRGVEALGALQPDTQLRYQLGSNQRIERLWIQPN